MSGIPRTPDGEQPAPRITPLGPREWPAQMRAALAQLAPPNPRHPAPARRPDQPKALNLLGTFARHPDLAHAYHALIGHLLSNTTLTPEQRELVILRVAARRNAAYEWLQHVVVAEDLGIDRSTIERVASDPRADDWTALDAALLAAVDELVDHAEISDAVWSTLSDSLDEAQLLDVIFTVGAYDALAMMMKSVRVELDDDLL